MHPRLGSSSGLTDVLKVRGSVLARRKPVKRSRWAVLSLLTAAHTLSAAAALAVAPLAPVLLEALMIALAGEAPRFTVLLACLFGAGVGFSVVNPTTGKAIIERFSLRERGFAMGIKQTGLTLGGMLAAFTLPAVALRWGWQAAFTVAGACAAPGALGGPVSGRGPGRAAPPPAGQPPPRLAEVGEFLRNRSFVVLLLSGFTMALTQSSLLAYLALYARDRLADRGGGAGRPPG